MSNRAKGSSPRIARARTRLQPDARRKHLLRVGEELFARTPYEQVQMGDLAGRAGVSRALLYHYFPSKRDFFAAIVEGGAKKLTRLTKPDPALPPLERLRASIDAYLDYVEHHQHSYLAIHRGGLSADRRIQTILARDRRQQERRILEALTGGSESSQLQRLAVRGWLAFLRSACLDWLETREPDRDAVRELSVQALVGTVLAVARVETGAQVPTPVEPAAPTS